MNRIKKVSLFDDNYNTMAINNPWYDTIRTLVLNAMRSFIEVIWAKVTASVKTGFLKIDYARV
jgi:hypothetical protein